MMSTLLKMGLISDDVKPRICAFQCEYLLQNTLFLRGKKFVGTRHICEKNELNFDRFFWGEVGGYCTASPAGS